MRRQFDFVVSLEHRSRRWIVLISQLLLLLALLLVLQPVVKGVVPWQAGWPALPILALWGFAFFRRRANDPPSYRWALSISAVCIYFATGNLWIATLYVFAALGLGAAAVQPEVGFSQDGLTINNLVPRQIEWTELKNVLIKDDVLTIDFKDNKLFQKNLSEPISPQLTEEFNAFCQERLKAKPPAEFNSEVNES